MQRVRCDCGAILNDSIDWCPQCHRPHSGTTAPSAAGRPTHSNAPNHPTGPTGPTGPSASTGSTAPVDLQIASGLSPAYFVRGRPPEPIAQRRRGHPERGRWAATDITFGPFGRVVTTVLVTLPILLFLYNLPFGVVGIVCYFTVYPRALRQIWQRADRM